MAKILTACPDKIKLQKIDISGCRLNFSDANRKVWDPIINSLKENLWIVHLKLDTELSNTSVDFIKEFLAEIDKNKMILKEIVPIMIEQEEKKRLEELEARRRMKSARLKVKKKEEDEEDKKSINLTGPLKEVKLVNKARRRPRRNSSGGFAR